MQSTLSTIQHILWRHHPILRTAHGDHAIKGSSLPFPSLAGVRYAEPTPGVLEIEPSMAWNPAVLAGVGVLEDPSSLYNR